MTVTTPERDPLSQEQLAAEYGYVWKVIQNVPELWDLFQTAFNDDTGQWTAERFGAAVKNLPWYEQNASFTRDAIIARAAGGADWLADLEEARQYVQQKATEMGVSLNPAQLDQYAERYIMEGWGTSAARGMMMESALADAMQEQPDLAGAAGVLQDNMRAYATANGLSYDDTFYLNAAQRIARGETTENDVMDGLRRDAASYWPTYSDQILSGANARDLMGAYISTYARAMEIDPNSIQLDDPVLRKALTVSDGKGGFTQAGLWDFEQSLRKTDRWKETKQAQDEMSSIGVGILQRMGFVGA